MTRNDIITANLFDAHEAATPFIKKDEAREFYYTKIEELKAEGYNEKGAMKGWTIAEYALRCTECEFIAVVPFEKDRIVSLI